MTTIYITGFDKERVPRLRELAEDILRQFAEHNDSRTVIVEAEARCHDLAQRAEDGRHFKIGKRFAAPFLSVDHKNLRTAENIAIALNKITKEAVQFHKIGGEIPAGGKES